MDTYYCPNCEQIILQATVLRYNTSDRPVEMDIPVLFCPNCGAETVNLSKIAKVAEKVKENEETSF